jgi:CheY-like chemotaxis protein
LVIEDHDDVREVFVDALTAKGWRVDTCVDGLSGLAAIESMTQYDLIITDNNLPFMFGVDLIQFARRMNHRQNVPILMVSGEPCRAEALRAGGNAFLSKPDDLDRFIKTVTELVTPPTQNLTRCDAN